uniref:Si:dkey-34d22.1 n=1 Tax=Myripristis murdjan TaxID=586833 RepID=A0A667Z8E3_9TELE
GTLASQNYPGTYPMDSSCKWRLRVPPGRMLRLLFGDFDIESSPDCGNGSLVITGNNMELSPMCGKLDASQKNVTINSNEVTITFKSGPHRSGRGFLLSYTTDQHPDLISCLQRGSHFMSQSFSVYCPAGCKNVTGDIWGNSEQGYRDTSVLCKSAVHAGATSDSLGGRVTVICGRSLTLYEATFANGILSKMGSLSEKKLLFSRECMSNLAVSGLNASSLLEKVDSQVQRIHWSTRNTDFAGEFPPWAADKNDPNPWLELELTDKSTVTGIITMGSNEFYVESYILLFSKDRKNWKVYKGALSKEKKVFEAHSDGHVRVLNSLFPPVVARFIRLQPLRWHGKASAQVQLLGCPAARVTPRSRLDGGDIYSFRQAYWCAHVPIGSSQPVIVAVGVVLGLIMCVSCLLAGVWWKRRFLGCQSFQGKSLSCPQSELISYPLERSVHDALPNPPLNDYAEPGVASIGQKIGSTFRPALDEGYTTPFTFNHYDTPGNLPEYAKPLPPEPEYATPFSEQPSESNLPVPTPSSGTRTTSTHVQYDCPSHRALSNGYCTPSLNANGPRPASAIYAEPQSSDSLLQKHTYEEPF